MASIVNKCEGAWVHALRASDDLGLPVALTVTARFRHALMAVDEAGSMVSVLQAPRLAGPKSLVVRRLPQVDRFVVVDACERFDVELPQGLRRLSGGERALMDGFLRSFAPAESLYRRAGEDPAVAEMLRRHARSIGRGDGGSVCIAGFGCGLTPSADDYLLGALAYCSCCGIPAAQALRANIECSFDATVPLSSSMLLRALDGGYPEVVLRFLRDRDATGLLEFLRHGSTSGFDLVFGMHAAAHGAFEGERRR